MSGYQPSHRHHYVPQFYLRGWTRPDGLLHGWCRERATGKLRSKATGTKGVCFERDLFTDTAVASRPDDVERRFFQSVDDAAATVLRTLNDPDLGVGVLDGDDRVAFARFMMSLERRAPEDRDKQMRVWEERAVKHFADRPAALKRVTADSRNLTLRELPLLCDSKDIGERVINLRWETHSLRPEQGSFVLSDRPLLRMAGLDEPGKLVWALALSPSSVLLCTDRSYRLHFSSFADLRKQFNRRAVGQARKYVFDICDGNLRCIDRWLARPVSR